eukprot:m.28764 g.28764  ORF g.28764 m.28764 type:complete len:204 (+) comp8032_c0_seq1:214-825(+)
MADAVQPAIKLSKSQLENATIQAFWAEHCKAFSMWFLLNGEAKRLEVIRQAMPDMPEKGPEPGSTMKPTDILLPELNMASMSAEHGRCLVLFFTRRGVENCEENDLRMLNLLHEKKILPSFSNGALDAFTLPCVNPKDPDENVLGLPKDAPEEKIAATKAKIKAGSLVHAEVWLAKKMRQSAINQFLFALIDIFRKDIASAKK